MALEDLGPMVLHKRGSMGVRAAAAEIGIGSATLSRVERGKLPDVETLGKICDWLEVSPSTFIGSSKSLSEKENTSVQVAFKKDVAISKDTSVALGKLILAAHKQFLSDSPDGVGH
ncbi:MAG: helix-turn-helix domain-containing protein [Sneathiella sp.]